MKAVEDQGKGSVIKGSGRSKGRLKGSGSPLSITTIWPVFDQSAGCRESVSQAGWIRHAAIGKSHSTRGRGAVIRIQGPGRSS